MARGSIGKRGNNYFIRYYVNGKQYWETIGLRKKDAEAALAERLRQINRGEFYRVPDITFKELSQKWLELKKSQVRPKTLASYAPHVKRLTDCFGDYKVKEISQEMVERFQANLSQRRDISEATQVRCLTLASSIFRKGIQWGYLSKNPTEFVSKPKVPKKEMDYLTPEEIMKLIESTDTRYRTLIMFACLTGARLSEILGLRWDDVDFEGGRVYIRQTLQDGKFYEPKSEKSKRSIAIPSVLVEKLKVHQLNQAVELDENPYNLVFPNSIGKPIDARNLTRRVLGPALRVAGLRRVGFHTLRHSYVSMLINQGENIKFIQKQVGHSSAKITWDIYSHLFPESEREAVARLEERLFNKEAKIGQKIVE